MAGEPIKRLKYFTGQFLEALDFKAEQDYHVGMRRRGNQALYRAGILDNGFQVSAVSGDTTRITISPGIGVDGQGREVVVASPLTVSLPPGGTSSQAYFVTLQYAEAEVDQQTPDADVSDNTRIEELPTVQFVVNESSIDRNIAFPVAKLTVATNGRLSGTIDPSVRQYADARFQGLTVNCDPGADNRSSLSKLGLSNRGAGGTPLTWNLCTAAVGGGGGVTPNAFEIWSDAPPTKQFELRRDGTTLLAPSRGNVGVGNGKPLAKLHVTGNAGILNLEGSNHAYIQWYPQGVGAGRKGWIGYGYTSTNELSIQNDIGRVNIHGTESLYLLNQQGVTVGKGGGGNGKLTVEGEFLAKSNLQVMNGAIVPATGNGERAGILFPKDAFGGSGDAASIRYYARSGEATTLELKTANDTDDHIALMPAGGVGIGTNEPAAKLHVTGNAGLLNLEGINHAYIQWYPQGEGAGRKGWIGYGYTGTNELSIQNDIGRVNIHGTESLYLLNQQGVTVGKGGGGNGKLTVEGDALVAGNVELSGTLNKLDVAEGNTHGFIRVHDLHIGHSTRHGGAQWAGRALVDDGDTLIVNYWADWKNVKIQGTVSHPSSRALKNDIRALPGAVAANIIASMEPVTFHFKSDPSKTECLGFIAEDMPPEVVTEARDGIVPNHIIAALVRVVKDQQQTISTLETRLCQLEALVKRQVSLPLDD